MEKLTKGILTAIAAILGGALLLWAAAAVLIALVAATVCLLLIYLLMPKECRAFLILLRETINGWISRCEAMTESLTGAMSDFGQMAEGLAGRHRQDPEEEVTEPAEPPSETPDSGSKSADYPKEIRPKLLSLSFL